MKMFHCECGQRVFFENFVCLQCGEVLGFDPRNFTLWALEESPNGTWRQSGIDRGDAYRLCQNRVEFNVCNWLVPAGSDYEFCVSCRLNRVIPNLSIPHNSERWAKLEQAKRRLLYTLLRLGLPVDATERCRGLMFEFLEDQRSNPLVNESHVLIGHADGVITLNVAEADDAIREQVRQQMGELYRTLLGHLRHESGHYYWLRLIHDSEHVTAFRELFGDERADYKQAIERYYQRDDQSALQGSQYVSTYAGAHPLEDWAECWAHYLHMIDTMETAETHGAVERSADSGFAAFANDWIGLSVTLNDLNRSMGFDDAYPFVLSSSVIDKLTFIHRQVERAVQQPEALVNSQTHSVNFPARHS